MIQKKKRFLISDKFLVFLVIYLIVFFQIFFYKQTFYHFTFYFILFLISLYFLKLKIFLVLISSFFFIIFSFAITKTISFFSSNYLTVISETKNYFICKKDFQNYFLLKKTFYNQKKIFIGMKIEPIKTVFFSFKRNFFTYDYQNYLLSSYIKGKIVLYQPNYQENKTNFLLNFKNYSKNLNSLFFKTLIFYNTYDDNILLKKAQEYNLLQYLIISNSYLFWLKKIYFKPLRKIFSSKIIDLTFLLFLLVYSYCLTFAIVIFRLLVKEFLAFFLKLRYHCTNILIWTLTTLFFLVFYPQIIGSISFFYCFVVSFFAIIFADFLNFQKINNYFFNHLKKILIFLFIFLICTLFSLYLNHKANLLAFVASLIIEPISIFFFVILFPVSFLQLDFSQFLLENADFLYQKFFFFMLNFSYFIKI